MKDLPLEDLETLVTQTLPLRVTPDGIATADGRIVAPASGKHASRKCTDCDRLPEAYMVRDEVWAAAGMASRYGFFCFACLERRLGRPLTVEDFSQAPINVPVLFGYMLAKREPTSAEGPSYHDLYVTTPNLPRTRLSDLPFRVRVECSRTAGWTCWALASEGLPEEKLGGEYGADWLVLDVAGYVICDGRNNAEADEQSRGRDAAGKLPSEGDA